MGNKHKAPDYQSFRLIASLEHKDLRRIARCIGIDTQGKNKQELLDEIAQTSAITAKNGRSKK